MDNKIRFAAIGLGEVFQKYHYDAIQKFGVLQVGCDVVMPVPKKAIKFETLVIGDWVPVVKQEDVDVVVVCTPNYLHVPIALAALDAGKKVILEKPVGITLESVQKLIDHPRSKDVAICFQRRFSEQAIALKKRASEIIHVDAEVFVRRDEPYWNEWRKNKETSGGANLMNIDIHYLDLLQWWLGELKVNFAKVAERNGIDQAVFAHFFGKRVDVQFTGSSLHDERKIFIKALCKNGDQLFYTQDTGEHSQVYDAFLNGVGEYVTPAEAVKSLKMVLDIYAMNTLPETLSDQDSWGIFGGGGS